MRMKEYLFIAVFLFVGQFAMGMMSDSEWDAPTYDWSKNDESATKACQEVNKAFNTSGITCSIDHISWDKHFKNEKTKEKISSRDDIIPYDRCGNTGWYFLWGQSAGGNYWHCPACDAEFAKMVKKVECRYDEHASSHNLSLKNGVLVFVMNSKGATSAGWAKKPMMNIFPAFKKHLVAHNDAN